MANKFVRLDVIISVFMDVKVDASGTPVLNSAGKRTMEQKRTASGLFCWSTPNGADGKMWDIPNLDYASLPAAMKTKITSRLNACKTKKNVS